MTQTPRQWIWGIVLRFTASVTCVVVPIGCGVLRDTSPAPCIPFNEDLFPLLVGNRTRLHVSHLEDSDCVPAAKDVEPDGWRWSSEDESVVQVEPDGIVRALGPGVFTLLATGDGTVLRQRGFALPPGWVARITPQDAVIRVGESVGFTVRAHTADGEALPMVYFSLYTPEWLNLLKSSEEPIVDKYSHQHIMLSGQFRGVRPGTTTITGAIGVTIPGLPYRGQHVEARLTVLP